MDKRDRLGAAIGDLSPGISATDHLDAVLRLVARSTAMCESRLQAAEAQQSQNGPSEQTRQAAVARTS